MIVPAQQVAKYSYGIYLAHTPDLAYLQAVLVAADRSSVDAVFSKLGDRLNGVFLPDRSPLHSPGSPHRSLPPSRP